MKDSSSTLINIHTNPSANLSRNFFSETYCDLGDGSDIWSDAHADFISSLSDQETNDLISYSKLVSLKPREQLFRTGDSSNDVYIVASGSVRLFQVSSSGKETMVWLSCVGEIFGLAELWQGKARKIHAAANELTEVYSISRKDFCLFISKYPETSIRAMGILSARVRALGHMLVDMMSDNVETRIARLLIRFASVPSNRNCHLVCDDELCVNVRLTHQDIASLVGASRQTVSTILSNLKNRGALRIVDKHIHIQKPDLLRHLLQFGVVSA